MRDVLRDWEIGYFDSRLDTFTLRYRAWDGTIFYAYFWTLSEAQEYAVSRAEEVEACIEAWRTSEQDTFSGPHTVLTPVWAPESAEAADF